MTTFSQLLDDFMAETKRTDMRRELASYLNQTVRECHFEPTRGNVVFLRANYREAQVTADVESGFGWSFPNPGLWQGVGAVRFDSVWDQGHQSYPDQVIPGRAGGMLQRAYQVAGDRILFRGYGGLNAVVSIAYYEYPPSLTYYESGNRPAEYSFENGWTYHPDYDTDDSTRETARILVSHWLLMRWAMVLEEGLRAKFYKRLSDTERARTSYSLFAQQRQGLITSEMADNGGSW